MARVSARHCKRPYRSPARILYTTYYYYYISVFTEKTGWHKDYVYFKQQTEYTQNFCRIFQANVTG